MEIGCLGYVYQRSVQQTDMNLDNQTIQSFIIPHTIHLCQRIANGQR